MCIRDRYYKRPDATAESIDAQGYFHTGDAGFFDEDGHLKIIDRAKDCLLYTSDAADERSSVDLGGRRIIKKQKSNRAS